MLQAHVRSRLVLVSTEEDACTVLEAVTMKLAMNVHVFMFVLHDASTVTPVRDRPAAVAAAMLRCCQFKSAAVPQQFMWDVDLLALECLMYVTGSKEHTCNAVTCPVCLYRGTGDRCNQAAYV